MTVTQVGTPGAAQIQSGNNSGSVTGAWSGSQPRTAGDLLVACVTAWGGNTASAITGPGGIWSLAVTVTSSTSRQTVAIFTAVAAGGDAAPAFTAAMTGTAANERMSCELFELTGQDTVTPVATTGTGDAAAATSVTITSTGNVSRAGSYAVDCVNIGCSTAGATLTYTPGTSWTEIYDTGSTAARAHSAADVYPNPPAGGTLSSNPSESGGGTVNEFSGVLIVVQPPGTAVGGNFATPVPPGTQSPMALSAYLPPGSPAQAPSGAAAVVPPGTAPAVPPGRASPMALGVPLTAPAPAPQSPPSGQAVPTPLVPPGRVSPMALSAYLPPGSAKPGPQPAPAPPLGTAALTPPGRQSPMAIGLPVAAPSPAPQSPPVPHPYTGRAQVLIAWNSEPFAAPVWTDVTTWVRLDRTITMQRGRQDNLSQIQAGRLTLTADNTDGRFTVGRSSSPWYPNVKIGRRIQVNVPDEHGVLHTRFDGLITELPVAWEGGPGLEALAVIQAADILAWLARQPPLLSWTQQEMLADNPAALWSLADTSSTVQATDQAGNGAAPLTVVSQGDGTGAAAAGSGVPLTEVQVTSPVAAQQVTTVYTFTTPGPVSWTAPLGTLVNCDVACVAGGSAGTNGGATAGAGGQGGEYAEEPALAITPGNTYTGTVGAPGAPPGGTGGNTTFTGDSVTVLANGSGSGSGNTIANPGGSGATSGGGSTAGGGGSSGGQYQSGNNAHGSTAGAAVTGGGAGGAGDTSGAGGNIGSAPGGGGGGGNESGGGTNGASGAPGQITITYTYIPPVTSQKNSAVSSWLFTPSATLAARILTGPLPAPVTGAAGFTAEIWAAYAGIPATAVTTYAKAGAISPAWPCPPGVITADVACIAGGQAGKNGAVTAGDGGRGGEYAEEPALAVTPLNTYPGTVGAAGTPSFGTGGNTTFTGDSVTVLAHGSGSGSGNTIANPGGAGGAHGGTSGGGGGSSGGQYQPGNNAAGSTAGTAVTGGGAGGAGDTSAAGGTPGSAPGGGGGGGHITPQSTGGSGAPGQITVTAKPGQAALLTLASPRAQAAVAVWVLPNGHLQLASTAGYGTRAPAWTTLDAGLAPSGPFHVVVSVAPGGTATLYVNGTAAGALTLPAGAVYTTITVGGSPGGWLGGWNGSAGLAAIYPNQIGAARVGVHYAAGTTAFTGSTTGAMIARIASYAGMPFVFYTPPAGPSDPSAGQSAVSYYNLNGQQPLTAMQQYELAEAGVIYVSAAGQFMFADRASRYAAGSAAQPAFALGAGQYEPDTSFKSNDQYLCTAACFATIHLTSGYPVGNAAAQLDFGNYATAGTRGSPQAGPFADATATAGTYSADDIMDAGNWQVNVLGQPVSRIPAATVDLLTQPPAEFSIAAFYAVDIGSAVQLQGLPGQAPDTAASALADYAVTEGLNETISLMQHDVQLYTSPLALNAAWIPGDPLLGVIGTTDVIGRSVTPPALGVPYTPVATFGPALNRTGYAGAQDWRTLTVTTQQKLTPPLGIAQQQNPQTVTTPAGQPVTFDTIAADTAAGFTSLTTYTVQPGYGGYYWCAAVVQAATGTGSLGGLAAWFAAVLGGVASQWGAKAIPYLSTAPYTAITIAAKIGPCAPGDTIGVIAAWAGSAGSMPLGTADGGSMFTLYWQGYT